MRSHLTPSRGSPSSSNLSINGANVLAGTLHIQGSDSFQPSQVDNCSVSLPNPTIAITPPPTSNPPQRPSQGSRGGTLPTAICAYYVNSIKGVGQGCLRVNCKFFHGTEEQLADLRKRHKRLKSPNGSNASTRSGSTVKSGDGDARPKEREPLQRLKLVKDNELGNKRPIVCLNYLTDTCHRPGCRFLHLPANVRPLPMTVCDYFSTGTCTRKRCRFFHGSQEVLSRMHAQGVTMYNPITNEPHDPATSLEELMKLQERTTVPLSAVSPTPPPQQAQQQPPQQAQTVCIINCQMPPPIQPYTIQYLTTTNGFAPPPRHMDPHEGYGMQQPVHMQQMMMQYHQPQYNPPPTTIVIQQGGGAGYPQQPMYAPQSAHHNIPESVLNAIMQQHPGATIIAAPAPMPNHAMPNYPLQYHSLASQHQPGSPFPPSMGPSLSIKGPQWGTYE